jgi:hypothetical protein
VIPCLRKEMKEGRKDGWEGGIQGEREEKITSA